MPGDFCLGKFKHAHQIADADFIAALEQVENPQSRAIGKRTKEEIDFVGGSQWHICLSDYTARHLRFKFSVNLAACGFASPGVSIREASGTISAVNELVGFLLHLPFQNPAGERSVLSVEC